MVNSYEMNFLDLYVAIQNCLFFNIIQKNLSLFDDVQLSPVFLIQNIQINLEINNSSFFMSFVIIFFKKYYNFIV